MCECKYKPLTASLQHRLLNSGGRAIATILSHNYSIREVNISGNGIGAKGVIPICKAIINRTVGPFILVHVSFPIGDWGKGVGNCAREIGLDMQGGGTDHMEDPPMTALLP